MPWKLPVNNNGRECLLETSGDCKGTLSPAPAHSGEEEAQYLLALIAETVDENNTVPTSVTPRWATAKKTLANSWVVELWSSTLSVAHTGKVLQDS
jgi:hypothetical protein